MRAAATLIALAIAATTVAAGCATLAYRQGAPSQSTFTVAASSDRVFDASLKVAQQMNLNVAVLEKSSGLLRLENSIVPAPKLDTYCWYFEYVDDTGEPTNSFANMGAPGAVSMTILLSAAGADRTAVDLRANWKVFVVHAGPLPFLSGSNWVELESKQVLEGEFRRNLELAVAEMQTEAR